MQSDFEKAFARLMPYAGPEAIPLSFVYGGTLYRGLDSALFRPSVRRETIDANIVRKTVTGRLDCGLEVRVEYTEYRDFPAVEWYAEFINRGEVNSDVLTQVRIADRVYPGDDPVLLHSNGDTVRYDGYQMFRTPIQADGVSLQTEYGSPSCGAFPFMRLMTAGGGYNIAVGWPGGWEARFAREEGGTHAWFAQEELEAWMTPGEALRAPRILVMAYDGDEEAGRKQWRDFYFAHILPRENGQPLKPMSVMSYGGGGVEFTLSTQENQLAAMDTYLSEGFRPDIWWIDAGWYPCHLDWKAAGTWKPNPEHYPHGLGPIGDKCHEMGTRFLLWFELERVTEGSELDREHPEWMLYFKEKDGSRAWTRMLKLADPDCLRWAIDRVDALLTEGHVDIYRQDFNIHQPSSFWHDGDGEGRRGVTENHHIQNLLTFWDTLLERHPGLLIDNCSSGGRRNDYELMRRSVPLHYTDIGYGVHPEKQQQYRVMFEWIPYFRALCMNWDKPDGTYGQWAMEDDPSYFDKFATYASFTPAIDQKLTPQCTAEEFATARKMLEIWRPAAELMLRGDYYPLMESDKRSDAWYACQFDDPGRGDGFIQILRNISCPEDTVTVYPHAEPGAAYEFTCMDPEKTFQITGEELTKGFSAKLPPRSSVVWFYKKR